MNVLRYLLFLIMIIFSACSSTEAKLLDLSGITFLIFCILVIGYLVIPKISTHPAFLYIHNKSRPVLRFFSYFVLFAGLLTFVFGIISEGLDRILLFISILIILQGFFMFKYSSINASTGDRTKYMRLTMLCISFLIAMLFIWIFGKEMLNL